MYWHPSEGDPAGIGMTVVYFWRLSNLGTIIYSFS